jgi:hypothetical protein
MVPEPEFPNDRSKTGVPKWAAPAVVALAAILILPGLGGGLWEPVEVGAVEAARSGGGTHAPLSHALPSIGLRAFGAREIAVRLPVALTAVLCVVLVAFVGAAALGRRAGLLGALVLATCPAFVFEGRLAASEILTTTAAFLGWAGPLLLGRIPWPAAAATSLVGVIVGSLSGGLLVGAALPLGAVGVTLILGERPAGRGRVVARAGGALALVLFAATIGLLFWRGVPAAWFDGPLRKVMVPPSFDLALKTLAHGAFPWSGLLPVALLHLLGGGGRLGRDTRTHLIAVVALGFAVALLASWRIAEIRYPALVAVALVVGVTLDDALRGEAGGPFAALLAACGVAILARDLFLSPESLLDAQRFDGLKYPIEVRVQFVHLGVGLAFAALAWLGLSWLRKALFGLAIAVPYAAFAAHGLMPQLGTHFSSKGLLSAYQRIAREGEPLAKYRVGGRGTGLTGAEIRELRTQPELLDYLRSPGRVFALVPAPELAALDQAARRAAPKGDAVGEIELADPGPGVGYFVLDDSSSRALLISNRLGKGETDRNALRRFVFREPTRPRRALRASFEGLVELTGFDLPDQAELGGKFRAALHFHVTGKLPPNWKVFVHFDAPAYRVIGDHPPLDGKFATQYWSVGDYIVDEFEVEVPRMTTPAGRYTAYMGFWPGGNSEKRLKITEGPNDGSDRVRLGVLHIK